MADVNGDGKPDLLFFDGTVLLGKGDGTFTTGTAWRTSTATTPIVNQFSIADFNGDGKPDIFFAGPLNGLSVMLGNGDGTFQAPLTTSIAAPVSSFLVGDVNGDGKPDVLTGNTAYIGKGDGTFAAGIISNALDASISDSLVDFNGDGKLDLFIAAQGVQLGNGNGTFQPLLPFPSGALTASATLGDYDGDGKVDVFVTGGTSTSPEIQVLFGNGDGTFHAATPQSVPANSGISSPVAVDLNGDGKADIVGSTGSAVQLFISKGDGTFTASAYYNAPTTLLATGIIGSTSIVVADFNGDHKKDVAAFNTMLLGNGDGTLQGNPAVPGAFGFTAMGDFNGDGHPDFASFGPFQQSPTNPSAYQANLNIWLNDGKNNFSVAHTYAINIPSPDVADLVANLGINYAVDLNGDSKLDLVGYIWDAGGLKIISLLGNGDGSFAAPTTTPVNAATNHLISLAFTLADVNGDNKTDLLVNAGNGPDNQGTLSVFLGNGDGTFTFSNSPFTSGAIGNVVVGNFNKDKKADVIVGTASGLGVLLGNGDGTFQPTTFISTTACGTACGNPVSGDFNGDGNLDLMLLALGGGYQVLLGKGDGTFNFSPVVPITPGTFGGFLQVGDFNGDGKLDVLGSIGSTNPLGLILGNGDGTFGSPLAVTNAGWPFIADFNGDNKLDILEVGANQLVWLYNNGQAAVTPPPGPPDFSVGSAGGMATVTAGGTATYSLSLASSGGFSGTVALTCSVAPAGPTCSVSPSGVAVSGSTAVTATVSVMTTARTGLLPTGAPNGTDSTRRILGIFGAVLAACIISLFASTRVRQRRFSWSLATAYGALLLLSAILMSGCGGSNSSTGSGGSTTGTNPGNYAVTVSAQSGSVVHKTQLTLTVQ